MGSVGAMRLNVRPSRTAFRNFPPSLLASAEPAEPAAASLPTAGTLADVEREYILRVLKETGGVISVTATRLGLPRTTLNALMQRLEFPGRVLITGGRSTDTRSLGSRQPGG